MGNRLGIRNDRPRGSLYAASLSGLVAPLRDVPVRLLEARKAIRWVFHCAPKFLRLNCGSNGFQPVGVLVFSSAGNDDLDVLAEHFECYGVR